LKSLLYIPDQEPEVNSDEWLKLDRPLLSWANEMAQASDTHWWQIYKKHAQQVNDRHIGPSTVVRSQVDDRWGSEFMPNGWRRIEFYEATEVKFR